MVTNDSRSVVITGGTKGIGLGMVEAFLARGCSVTFCGRSQRNIDETLAMLKERFPQANLAGQPCDVSQYEEVQSLWDLAVQRFGRVDIWINNAGTSNDQIAFHELPTHELSAVVESNLLGSVNGSHVALRGMRVRGRGAVYNMEGYGSDGSRMLGMALYGSTKYALRYFTLSLADEAKASGVQVCLLSPGVVITDLFIDVWRRADPAHWKRMRWLFKFIGDPVDVVSPWLAEQILNNKKNGVRIVWMTVLKAVLRVFSPYYHRRNLFEGTGIEDTAPP
ncbi:MAG: SDR family oxidoreductase [Polyangiaceae bacterium]